MRCVAIAIVAAGVFAFRDAIFGAPVDVREVVRGDIVQTVVASGRVMTPQRVSVGAVITERVARIPVDEGQSVHGGDVLIVLDDRDERAAVAQAQAAVEQARGEAPSDARSRPARSGAGAGSGGGQPAARAPAIRARIRT